MVHRHAGAAVAAFWTAGAVAGASVTAALALVANGLLRPVPERVRGALLIAVLAVLVVDEGLGRRLRLPQRARQIDREVFTARHGRAAFRFAAELGLGFRTYLTRRAPYGLAAALVLLAPVGVHAATSAAIAAAGFGVGRSVIVIAQAASGRRSLTPSSTACTAFSLLSLWAVAVWALRTLL